MSQAQDQRPRDRLTGKVLAVCDAVGSFIEAWGFKSIHGRVWSLLMLSTEPMSQSEVAEFLGVSRSLINLAVSELTDYGLVRPVDATRNAPYEACVDVWPTITDVLRNREWMLVERARLSLESMIDEMQAGRVPAEAKRYDLRRAQLLLGMTEFAQATLRLFLGIRMPRSLADFHAWLGRAAGAVRKLQETLPKVLP